MAQVTHPGALAPRSGPVFNMAPIKQVAIRKTGSKVMQAALSEKHTLTAMAAAGALGLAERNNVPLPHLAFLGRAGTYGALAWAIGRYTGNRTAEHLATGLLSVASYQLAAGKTAAGVSGDETIMGEI